MKLAFQLVLACLLGACGSDTGQDDGGAIDLRTSLDSSALDFATVSDSSLPDAADGATADLTLPCNATLFVGGLDPAAQGWQITSQPNATIATPGPGITQLLTSMQVNSRTSGQLLLSLPGRVTKGQPFAVEFVLQVLAVNNHNSLDAAVALMGSFTAPAGSPMDRAEMIYIDGDKIGWADDSQSHAVSALDGQFHTYRLAVDGAGNAVVSRDGTPMLQRAGYTTTGTIALGDQTNDPGYDATIQVRSVSLVCP